MHLIPREEAWRGMIAREATIDSFEQLALAVAKWLKSHHEQIQVMIGYDTRFMAEEFSRQMAEVLLNHGIDVFLSTRFSTTAMLGLASTKRQMQAGIMLTGGELSATFSGVQIVDAQGAVVLPAVIKPFLQAPIQKVGRVGTLAYFDIEAVYYNHLKEIFDTKQLKAFGSKFCYDVNYGAAQRILKKLFPLAEGIRASRDVLFGEKTPVFLDQPSVSTLVKEKGYDFGFSLKGDAKRLQVWHASGVALDYQWNLLFMIYLFADRYAGGKLLLVRDSAARAAMLAEVLGMTVAYCEPEQLFVQATTDEEVILAGDEQGKLALYGNIMLPDAVFVLMELMQYLQQAKTSLQALIDLIEAKLE